MPFDGASFPKPIPGGKRRGKPQETAAIILIVVIAGTLLIMPVSIAACVDVIRYLQSG